MNVLDVCRERIKGFDGDRNPSRVFGTICNALVSDKLWFALVELRAVVDYQVSCRIDDANLIEHIYHHWVHFNSMRFVQTLDEAHGLVHSYARKY